MKPTLEKQVRKLDDETKTISESARQVAERLGCSVNTAEAYLVAKRQGYNSYHSYLASKAAARGVSRTAEIGSWMKERFGSTSLAIHYYATSRGHESNYDYQNELARRYGFETQHQLAAFRKGLPIPAACEKSVECLPPSVLDRIPAETTEGKTTI